MLAKMISNFSLWITGETSNPDMAVSLRKTPAALHRGLVPKIGGGSCLCVFEDFIIEGKCKKICFLNTSVFIKNILRFIGFECLGDQVVRDFLIDFYGADAVEQCE